MQRRLTLLALAAILLTAPATSQEVQVTPGNYDFSIDPGDSYSQDISVKWNGESPVVATLMTEVTTEGENIEGFNVSYEEKRFILVPGQPVPNEIRFNTSTALKSADYRFLTKAKVQVPVKVETDTDTEYVVREDTVYVNNTELSQEEIDELMKELNQTRERLEEKNQSVDSLREEKDNLSERVQRLRDSATQLQDKLAELRASQEDDEKGISLVRLTLVLWALFVTAVFAYINRDRIEEVITGGGTQKREDV